MKRGYRANSTYSFSGYFEHGQYATFTHSGCGSYTVSEGLESMAGPGKSSNPYKDIIDQGMPGNTHIMNPSENVGNPYNLIKKSEAIMPTRIRKRTPIKVIKRGEL